MILLNNSSFIKRDLKVSGNVWSSAFFHKTEQKVIIDEKVALFGVLGCDLYESKGTTANDINVVLLVAKMCISKVKKTHCKPFFSTNRKLVKIFLTKKRNTKKNPSQLQSSGLRVNV